MYTVILLTVNPIPSIFDELKTVKPIQSKQFFKSHFQQPLRIKVHN